ncbi:MAG: O-antigen polymerase [Ramlibacter sp.]|nr:O-antigen polymerase [Ramlibacter sp.]
MRSAPLAAQAAPWLRLSTGVPATLVLLLALPWLWPFAPGPSSNVVPWLASMACALLAFLLAAPVRPGLKLLAVLGAAVLWVGLRSLTGVLDRAAFAGACVLALLAYSTAAGAVRDGEPAIGWIAWSWLLAALVSALLALLQYFDLAGGLQPWVYAGKAGDALANLRQRNQLATLTTIGLAAALWLAGRRPGRLPWWLAAVVLLAVANAATTSRTGLLQWLLVLGLCALWRGPESRRRLALAAAGLLAYAAAAAVLPHLLERFTGATADTLLGRLGADFGCSSRRVLWGNVLQLVAQRPFVGWGWGELDYAHFMHLYGQSPRFCDILDNAHNLPLHVAVELGVPAALLLCGAVVWGVVRARPWRETEPHRQLAWCVLAVLAIHSLLEYPLWYGPFQIALGLALGLLVRPGDATQVLAARTRAGVAACGLALLAYAAWDYERVSQIYLEPEQRLAMWRDNTLSAVRKSWLFSGQARFAELTLATLSRDKLEWTDATAQAMLHYSPEPRVIEKVIESATMAGRYDEAVLYLARYRAAFPEDYAKWRAAQKGALPAL